MYELIGEFMNGASVTRLSHVHTDSEGKWHVLHTLSINVAAMLNVGWLTPRLSQLPTEWVFSEGMVSHELERCDF